MPRRREKRDTDFLPPPPPMEEDPFPPLGQVNPYSYLDNQKQKPLKQNKVKQSKEMDTEESTPTVQETVTEPNTSPALTNIINEDDKLLFSLNVLGSLQKNEKLINRGELLSIDERWFFQGVRRWWSVDSKEKSSNKAVMIITATAKRVKNLLDEDYLAKLQADGQRCNEFLDSPDGKKFKETCEERRRLINKYFIALNKAKSGLGNIRDTYDDKFTKEAFKLSIEKVDDILILLQKFERSS